MIGLQSTADQILLTVLRNLGLIVGFLLGVGIIPLLAYVLPTPWLIAGPVGRITAFVGANIYGRPILNYRTTGVYEIIDPETKIERASDNDVVADGGSESVGPDQHWIRWLGRPFGLAYERTADAWGDAAEYVDRGELPDVELIQQSPPGEHRQGVGITRDGIRTFFDARESGGLVVSYLQALHDHVGAAGLWMVLRSKRNAMEDFGGDTNEYGIRANAIAVAALFTIGLAAGILVVA